MLETHQVVHIMASRPAPSFGPLPADHLPIGGLRRRLETDGYYLVSSCGQLLTLVSIFSPAVPDKHRLQHAEEQSHL